VDPQHFQPGRVPVGSVPEKVSAYNVALRPIALSQIDQTRTLGAQRIQSQAQCVRLSIIVHA
jgi:hypothetical protein